MSSSDNELNSDLNPNDLNLEGPITRSIRRNLEQQLNLDQSESDVQQIENSGWSIFKSRGL